MQEDYGPSISSANVPSKLSAKSEQRFRALVTASSDVLYRMSPDLRQMRELNEGAFCEPGRARSRLGTGIYSRRRSAA